jgi:hypothetical protein
MIANFEKEFYQRAATYSRASPIVAQLLDQRAGIGIYAEFSLRVDHHC